jgi:hypothetical protein
MFSGAIEHYSRGQTAAQPTFASAPDPTGWSKSYATEPQGAAGEQEPMEPDRCDKYHLPRFLKSDEFSFFLRPLSFGDGRRPIAL